MCTITLKRLPHSLLLTMNRDELRSRPAEQPPSIQTINNTRYLAPRDGQAGGTWVGVNQHGLCACLHNGHAYNTHARATSAQQQRPSRGEIIPQFMGFTSVAESLNYLNEQFNSTPYPPFTLILADNRQTISAAWNEQDLRITEHPEQWLFFASSGLGDAATEWRRGKFLEWIEQGEFYNNGIPDFHLLHDPDHPDLSPLMSNPQSRTRSITQILTDDSPKAITMRYIPIAGARLGESSSFVL